MSSNLFRLNIKDFVKGATSAVFAALAISLYNVTITEGFDVFTADWGMIGKSALNWAIAAFLGYLGKNLVSDKEGKVFGRIG